MHLKMNYHDHPEEVHVTLYVKKIIEDSLKIEFDHHSLQVTFKTQYCVILFTVTCSYLTLFLLLTGIKRSCKTTSPQMNKTTSNGK